MNENITENLQDKNIYLSRERLRVKLKEESMWGGKEF